MSSLFSSLWARRHAAACSWLCALADLLTKPPKSSLTLLLADVSRCPLAPADRGEYRVVSLSLMIEDSPLHGYQWSIGEKKRLMRPMGELSSAPSTATSVSVSGGVTTEKTYSVTQDSCGCLHLTECACRQFVQPEYKPEPTTLTVTQDSCGCLHLAVCPCRSSSTAVVATASTPSTLVVTKDACGCLHLAACACRPAYQTPEIKDTLKETIAPEIKKPDANCECEGKPTCGCSSIQIVPANSLQVESSSCGCLSQPVCGCRPSLSSNDVVGESVFKPITVGA